MIPDASTVTRPRGFLPAARRLTGCAWVALILSLATALPVAAVDQLHIVSRWPGNVPEHYFWNGAQFLGWNVVPVTMPPPSTAPPGPPAPALRQSLPIPVAAPTPLSPPSGPVAPR
jgi:hypothetical protein